MHNECLDNIAKICDFFQSDGIVFMPPSHQNLILPTFGKYALMFDRTDCEYIYAAIEMPRMPYNKMHSTIYDEDYAPMFYDKENLLYGMSDALISQMIKKTLEMIKRAIDDSNIKICARDMTSTRSIDIEIWKGIDNNDELFVQIDLGLTINHEIEAKKEK